MNQEIIEVPVLDKIKLSNPIAKEYVTEVIKLPAFLLRGNSNFIIRMSDDSMIGAGILKDDYILVAVSYTHLILKMKMVKRK